MMIVKYVLSFLIASFRQWFLQSVDFRECLLYSLNPKLFFVIIFYVCAVSFLFSFQNSNSIYQNKKINYLILLICLCCYCFFVSEFDLIWFFWYFLKKYNRTNKSKSATQIAQKEIRITYQLFSTKITSDNQSFIQKALLQLKKQQM